MGRAEALEKQQNDQNDMLVNQIDHKELERLNEEKMMLEQQLERVTLEMASVQNVVTEMTQSFKNQIVIKDQEVKKCQEANASLRSFNNALDKKCRDLEELEMKIESGHKEMKVESDYENLEHGSLDDLSNLV